MQFSDKCTKKQNEIINQSYRSSCLTNNRSAGPAYGIDVNDERALKKVQNRMRLGHVERKGYRRIFKSFLKSEKFKYMAHVRFVGYSTELFY